MGPVLRLLSFVLYTLNVRVPGLPGDTFGSVMITNVGSLGLDVAYPPLVPFSRVPILIAVGAVADEPVVEGDRVVPAKVFGLHATFDHRFIDGYHAATMSRVLRERLEDPERYFG
jgi:pyruvate dehydrogenase E2 component (dihydrolipoamide acetyltransferase)